MRSKTVEGGDRRMLPLPYCLYITGWPFLSYPLCQWGNIAVRSSIEEPSIFAGSMLQRFSTWILERNSTFSSMCFLHASRSSLLARRYRMKIFVSFKLPPAQARESRTFSDRASAHSRTWLKSSASSLVKSVVDNIFFDLLKYFQAVEVSFTATHHRHSTPTKHITPSLFVLVGYL